MPIPDSYNFQRYLAAKKTVDDRALNRQVWDTLANLRGSHYEVREAFFLIFRRSGPLYILPEQVPGEGVTLFPVLVDIAPTSDKGSRQRRKPREITIDELRPTK